MRYVFMVILFFMCHSGIAQVQPYWKPVVSGTQKKLLSISFGEPRTGYIGGVDSTLLKTTDGGQTWSQIALPNAVSIVFKDIVDVQFVSAQTGYITLSNIDFPLYQGVVYKTTDGGSTWNEVDAGNTAAARSYFLSEGNGFVIGSAFFAGSVVSKISGGNPADYHYFSSGPSEFLRAIDFRNAQTGIVAGDNGLVCRTLDGGITWDTLRMGIDSAIYAVRFLDDSTVLAGTNNPGGSLFLSTDTGRTWHVEMNSLTFDYPVMRSIAFSRKDSFIAVGASQTFEGEGIIYWHDHIYNRTARVDHRLNGVTMKNDTIAYAVGDSGLVVTNFPGDNTPTGISRKNKPSDILKIYPNPVSGLFTTALPVAHTITVYDVAGKMVWSNSRMQQQHTIDLSGYPAGMYVVEAATDDYMVSGRIIRQ